MWRFLWNLLANERGQFNLNSFLDPLLRGVGTGVGNFISQPRNLLGAGLIGAGLFQREEPGYATEATQYLRNRLSPTGLSSQFSGQIGALNQEYLPYLTQQRNQLLDATQQRFISGLPSSLSTAQGGPEIAGIRNAIVNQILPAERAHAADIGRYLLSQGGSAAGALLEYAKPDDLGQLLTMLGLDMLNRRGTDGASLLPGGPNNALSGQSSPLLQGQNLRGSLGDISRLFGGNNSLLKGLGLLPGGQVLDQASGQAFNNAVSQLLNGQTIGAFEQAGDAVAVLDQAGNVIGGVLPDGTVINGANGTVAGSLGSSAAAGGFQGLLGAPSLSSLGGALSGLGSGLGGFFLGNQLAPGFGSNQFQSSALGAAGGAGAGFLVGGPIGAVIGGISGLIGGFMGEREQQHALKAQRLAADLEATQSNQARVGSFWTQALGAAGFPGIEEFANSVRQITANINDAGSDVFFGTNRASTGFSEGELIAQMGSQFLLRQIQSTQPSITSLDQVPNFRQGYIDYLMQNYQIESGGGLSRPSSTSQFGSLLERAGLSQ